MDSSEAELGRFIKAVDLYCEVEGVRVLVWKYDGGRAMAAQVGKANNVVSLRAVLARACGLRLYPGETYDLLTPGVRGGQAPGARGATGSSRPAASQAATPEPPASPSPEGRTPSPLA